MTLFELWRTLVASLGAIYTAILFAVAMVYAFWPSNKTTFEEAARMPLEED